MDKITEYFTQFYAEESLAILTFLLIAFLFGLLIAYLIWGSKLRKARKQIRERDQLIATLEGETNRLKEELALKEADLQKANFELEEWNKTMKRLENEKSQLRSELYTSKDIIKELKASNQTYGTTVEDLNHQILTLQSQNDKLAIAAENAEAPSNDLAALQSTYNATNSRLNAFEEKLNALEAENTALKSTVGNLHTSETTHDADSLNHFNRLENRIEELAEENQWLKSELARLGDNDGQESFSAAAPLDDGTTDMIAKPVNTDKGIYGGKIDVADAPRKDDLTKIDGIGPFIAKKLNDIGIYSYEQIAAFDEAQIEQVTKDIQFLPGRIDKDNWVGQASNLSYSGEEDALEAFSADSIPVPPVDAANLQIVEGIGPKIEEKLKAAGIDTLHDLSSASIASLKEILDKAGSHYRIHDPSTWPDQAKLAAAGDWGKLKTYQDYLIGGKDPAKNG